MNTVIERVKSSEQLGPEFWSLLQALPGRDFALSDLAFFFKDTLSDENAVGVWIVHDAKTLLGCVVAIPPEAFFRSVFVLAAHLEAVPKPLQDALIRSGEAWARSVGARHITMITPRDTPAWARRFGFEKVGVYMQKEIGDVQGQG